nr:WD repeat domain-containing protein 83 isoform X2 [Syngnathus scovelli]
MQLNCPRLFSSGLCAQLVRQQQHLLVQFRQDGDPLGRGHGSGGSQISMVRRAQKINCVQFNEEATVILSGRHTKTKSPRLRRRYTGHTMKGYKLECCLSCKDTHVLSCSEDGHVYFWDLVEGWLSLKLPVGKAVVKLFFHPTQPRLLTASEGCVQVWAA